MLHLLHAGCAKLGGFSNAGLDRPVLLLCCVLILDGQLGIVEEGLLLKVEIVLCLNTELISLLVRLLEDEVDHRTDLAFGRHDKR